MKKLIIEKPKTNNKLIIEERFNPCEIITENVSGKQRVYIQGIFSIFNTKNQNGRIYPREVMEPEVARYMEKYVKSGRALGELDHPPESTINLDRVSHRIVNLWIEGDKVMGKALLGGPMGESVKQIFDMGGVLGVSSRSLGSLNHRNEVDELQLITWDIVHEPSVSQAIMGTITESKTPKVCTGDYCYLNDNTGFINENLKREIKTINNNSLLTNEERTMYAELYMKKFFNELYNK